LHTLTRDEAVLRTLLQDLGYAVRVLARRPGFSAIVVLTIALGIGANAAIFTVVNGILLEPLPYPHPDQIVSFGHEPPQWLSSEPDFLDYHRELKSFQGLAAYSRGEATLSEPESPERLQLVRATEDFFPVLGVAPLIGRTFGADEYTSQPPKVVIISWPLWQWRFGGDRSIVGRTISIEGVQRTVVGIMPPRFAYPEARTDLWMPMPRFHPSEYDRDSHYLFMVGRLQANVPIEKAFAEANGLAKRIMRTYPTFFNPREPLTPHIRSIADDLVGGTRPYLFALLGAVGFVLLISCANVANLLLVRGESRHKEMAVRSALGASRLRLLIQLVAESLVLATIGGVFALVLASLGCRLLVAIAPESIPRLDEIRVDWRVVLFTAAVTLAAGLVVGLLPGLRASRENASGALRDAGRTTGTQAASRAARRVLVMAELALALITLTGTGMLVRSLWNLQHARLGFDPRNVFTASVALSTREYDDPRAALFFDQLLSDLRSRPGVVAAGAAGWLPVVNAGGLWGVTPEGRQFVPGQMPSAVPQQITPGYLRAMGLDLLAGRDFEANDGVTSPPVAIVSQRLAELLWPNENALGKRMKVSGTSTQWMTVVGLVSDIRARGFADVPEPTMYLAYAQTGKTAYSQPRAMALVIRTMGDPASIAPAVRSAVRHLDPTVPVAHERTMEQIVGISVADRRFSTALLAGFAALALLLAGIGIYGVISYGVTQRHFEIGLRIALGAGDRSVLALILSEGLRISLVGLGVGLIASLALGRAIRAMLVDVPAIDLPTLALASAALLAVALLAAFVPARRATTVSPIAIMRGR
ncbi:MAG TPA: ABC transporter permease, partial [Gemmatimonadaceae bacterium]|nr:ABC transporter permease [Gemmatimonadaceae bacterium]